MAIQKSRVSIFPKSGMDPRTVGGVKWIRNMKRWTATAPLEVRPGFGQRAQLDSTTGIPQDNKNEATGGFIEHLGSYLYNSNYGRRQILSVFSVECNNSTSNAVDMQVTYTGTQYDWYNSVHGINKCAVFSIFDLETKTSWEELITFKTSELSSVDDIDKLHGHFESVVRYNWFGLIDSVTKKSDYRAFKSPNKPVSFQQISDSVYFSSPELGVWVYHGIDVPATIAAAKIDTCVQPQWFAMDDYFSNNLHSGRSEGSVIKPVSGTTGINGKDVVYLTKAEMPRSVGMAEIGGRIAYTYKNLVWFSDVNQPGAVMADNFAAWSADGLATAISSYQNRLFIYTEKEVHSFQLRPQGAAGSPIPGLVDIISVETNHEAGCVSAKSHCWTPYGSCFVSTWGVHLISNPETITTISDQVYDHWGDGLKDPLSNYNINQGKSGEAGKQQAPMLFSHDGEPSVTYDIEGDSVLICYETHVLIYHFETKCWNIWPLGVRNNNPTSAGSYFASFTGKAVVSDSAGVYIISGMQDLDDSVSANPYSESTSYVIGELGLGGGIDRTIENEDYRGFGIGREKMLEPTNSFAGGAAPAVSVPGDSYMQNGWLLMVEPVDSWIGRGGSTEFDTQYKSYDLFFLRTENADHPYSAISLMLDVAGGWVFDVNTVGTHSQSGPKSGFTITTPSASRLSVVTPAMNTAPVTKLPLLRFTIANATSKTLVTLTDPIFSLYAAEAQDATSTLRSIRMKAWMSSYRFPHTNNRWNALSALGRRTVGTHASSGDPYFFDGASVHERDIEWAFVSGELGAGDGGIHRIRDIRCYLESGGQDDTSATEYIGLYNSTVASDYKMLSGQKQDYSDPYVANRQALKKETIRDRMTSGKRLFDSVAKWSDGTGSGAEDYLIDNPEINEIDISTHARGESVIAAVFGRVRSFGAYLKIKQAIVTMQTYASNRRKGR